VLAVGNPLGLESTVTQGIVSSLGRAIDIFDAKETHNYGISNFIQTDAAINPGNSGGGLFNIRGEVIGINAAIASQTGTWTGYGFAIPINMAKEVTMDLIKNGKVNRGYIGVQISAIDQTTAEAIGLDRPRGVRVDNVTKGGAGEAAGLKENDVILSVDGHPTDAANELQSLVAMHHAGDRVALHIWRDGKELDKTVTLKGRPELEAQTSSVTGGEEENGGTNQESSKSTLTLDNVGMTVRNLTSSDKEKYGVSNGIVITNVEPASEAWDRHLGTNMVITQAAHQAVKNVSDFERIVDANKGKAVGMMVTDAKGDAHFYAIMVPNE
jgi:serine protease Do